MLYYAFQKDFSVKEVRSQTYGLCFTLTSSQPFHHHDRLVLALRKDGPGIVAYFHEPGAEFWIKSGVFMQGAEIESEEFGDELVDCFIEFQVGT